MVMYVTGMWTDIYREECIKKQKNMWERRHEMNWWNKDSEWLNASIKSLGESSTACICQLESKLKMDHNMKSMWFK